MRNDQFGIIRARHYTFAVSEELPALEVSNRVWTLPNLISFARMGLVPVFVVLFARGSDAPALAVLFVLGNTDWVDGMVARKTGQVSELGKILDPISDRIAIAAVMLVILFRGLIPLWLGGVILARELLVAIAFGILERRGVPRIPVNIVGKAATLAVFSGMGLIVISVVVSAVEEPVRLSALGVLILGAALYWVATAMYFVQLRSRMTSMRQSV